LAAIAFAGLGHAAAAQPARDQVATGRNLAGQYCVTCHVITPSEQGSWTDAPKFTAIANRPGITAAAISATVQKSHVNMMNDQRPKPEADAIAAYVMSLRKR